MTGGRKAYGRSAGRNASLVPTTECRPWIAPKGTIAGWRLPAVTNIAGLA